MADLLRLSTVGQATTERPNAVAADSKVTLDAGRLEESSDITSTSSSSGSSDEGDVAQQACWIPGPVWRNIRSHVVHRCSSFKKQTLCGRLIDDAHFEYMAEGCSTINARCRGSSVEGLVEALDQSRLERQRAK